jgi:3'-phosphoadenosine 5'-phosphosulfate sulfotransferase (PAPS reductase)/FAD synthetase
VTAREKVKTNPYLIEGPTLISFSGGRTSGYMLWHILDAHGGKLPDNVHVCFANTGKEREETLRFVHDCETNWGVRVHWLEWLPPPPRRKKGDAKLEPAADAARRFEEVGYNSANRDGAKFANLIRRKQYLPNPIMRYCTIELKIRVMRDFMIAEGNRNWTNAVGIRADEMLRAFKVYERNNSGKERFRTVLPLVDAGVREADVLAFWRDQPFDLQLKPHEGNCDLCFLKGRDKRAAIIRADPASADWWIAQEDTAKCSKPDGARFRKDETFRQLRDAVLNSPLLPFEPDGEEFDAECGLWCPGEEAA